MEHSEWARAAALAISLCEQNPFLPAPSMSEPYQGRSVVIIHTSHRERFGIAAHALIHHRARVADQN
jgi:hypothetical protein